MRSGRRRSPQVRLMMRVRSRGRQIALFLFLACMHARAGGRRLSWIPRRRGGSRAGGRRRGGGRRLRQGTPLRRMRRRRTSVGGEHDERRRKTEGRTEQCNESGTSARCIRSLDTETGVLARCAGRKPAATAAQWQLALALPPLLPFLPCHQHSTEKRRTGTATSGDSPA
jgi:hypothetical protein